MEQTASQFDLGALVWAGLGAVVVWLAFHQLREVWRGIGVGNPFVWLALLLLGLVMLIAGLNAFFNALFAGVSLFALVVVALLVAHFANE